MSVTIPRDAASVRGERVWFYLNKLLEIYTKITKVSIFIKC